MVCNLFFHSLTVHVYIAVLRKAYSFFQLTYGNWLITLVGHNPDPILSYIEELSCFQ